MVRSTPRHCASPERAPGQPQRGQQAADVGAQRHRSVQHVAREPGAGHNNSKCTRQRLLEAVARVVVRGVDMHLRRRVADMMLGTSRPPQKPPDMHSDRLSVPTAQVQACWGCAGSILTPCAPAVRARRRHPQSAAQHLSHTEKPRKLSIDTSGASHFPHDACAGIWLLLVDC